MEVRTAPGDVPVSCLRSGRRSIPGPGPDGGDMKPTDLKSAADKVEEVCQASLPSVHASVQNFCPTFNAKTGGNIISPSIIGSTIGTLNISIVSTGQGSHGSSNCDGGGGESPESPQPQNFRIGECREKLKADLTRKFSHLPERMTTGGHKTALDKIYTELYITEGSSRKVNKEHEVTQIEMASKTKAAWDKSICCNSLFVSGDVQRRTVITMGVAGIGKTVSANKFTLDWAEGRANAHLDFVFPLSFRELNLMRKRTLSLAELVCVFFPETRDTGIFTNGDVKVLFILDGLDESRLALNFKSEMVTDVTQLATVAVLLTNLIRANLLPLASVWITTRPAASGQIPTEYIDLVTEVRGFDDAQKEEYFKKRIEDRDLAKKIIAHVKSCRSLHIMCHIPVFCRMAASVLEKKLSAAGSKDTPKTLTQMYIHFLSIHAEGMKTRLHGRRESNSDCVRANLISLGKLAFRELEKGQLIFYQSDLTSNGIKVSEAAMFSGVYTQVFSEEPMLCQEKMFCFVHLTIQEFFAALYVFLAFHNDNDNVLTKKSSASRRLLFRNSSELILYKEAVERALRSDNGEFDIFLRFLLGLSLEPNQSLVKHLMTSNRTRKGTREAIIDHIKERIRSVSSTDRCLNLFHCLNELNDHSMVEEIQRYLKSGGLARGELSPAQWSTLVYVLLTSEEELGVFELSKYSKSQEGLQKMLPVVKTAQVVDLSACNLTAESCMILNGVMSSSRLRELDLSNNNVTDAGVRHLSMGLESCKLETLRLRSCSLTEHSSDILVPVLCSTSCHLKVLDLSDNDLQDLGVKTLAQGLKSHHCKLEKLGLSLCRVTEKGCRFLEEVLRTACLRELNLSQNYPGDSGLKLLSDLLDNPQCTLKELSVAECDESRIQPGPKKYTVRLTLDPDTANRDLSLTEGNRKATRWIEQPYPDHLDRFDFWRQVLCKEGLTGRCYWETEWTGRPFIGVAYRRMCRKGEGDDSWLGRNELSWGLNGNGTDFKPIHNRVSAASIAYHRVSNRVAVYLDWTGGTLSFYSVSSGERTLIHTFHTAFTEPVYPAFALAWANSTVFLC